MNGLTVLLLLAQALQSPPSVRDPLAALLEQVRQSGRVLALIPTLDDGIRIAPGAPPLLAFRYLDGKQRGRFGGLDLVLDDAGH